MNEEKLWEEIENCLEYDNDIYGGDSVFLHTTSIENLMDWFKNKEANLLKEFVERYNCHLQKILVHEQELYDSATQQNHIENATFYLGEKTMLERLIYWLSQDLENFIKEREK